MNTVLIPGVVFILDLPTYEDPRSMSGAQYNIRIQNQPQQLRGLSYKWSLPTRNLGKKFDSIKCENNAIYK